MENAKIYTNQFTPSEIFFISSVTKIYEVVCNNGKYYTEQVHVIEPRDGKTQAYLFMNPASVLI